MKPIKIVALLVIVVGMVLVGYQLWKSVESPSGGSMGYADFSQAAQQAGKEFHVVGWCNKNLPAEYHPQINPDLFTFYMTDQKGKRCFVNLHKSKPQDFDKSEQVVLIGSIRDTVFEASDILLKCPSKYNDIKDGKLK